MKILGKDYDTRSQQHMDNQQEIQMLNMELSENVEQSMQLTREEEGKLVKRKKFDARDRIRKLLDRGSPWLALG